MERLNGKNMKKLKLLLAAICFISVSFMLNGCTGSDSSVRTIEELQTSREIDGIVEPVFTQDCFPRTLQEKGVTRNCFERANLGDNTACSDDEIKMIKEYYKKGQDKDPLNDGSGNFCAL